MNYRSIFFALTLAFFSTGLWAQPGASISYKSFIKDYQSHLESFTQSGAAVSAAAAAHMEAIQAIFAENNIELSSDKKRFTKRRQSLYDWMINWAPVYGASFASKPDDLDQAIDVWVRDFSQEFGLTVENTVVIRQNLANYINAYIQYQKDYGAIQSVLLMGGTPPPVPPPPPAPQQHHTSG